MISGCQVLSRRQAVGPRVPRWHHLHVPSDGQIQKVQSNGKMHGKNTDVFKTTTTTTTTGSGYLLQKIKL